MRKALKSIIAGGASLTLAFALSFLMMSCGRVPGGPAGKRGFVPAGERVQAPSWEFAGLGRDGSISASDAADKVVVLHFWASWCPPCRMEFPSFARWAGARPMDSAIEVIPVSIDENVEKGRAFYEGAGVPAAGYHGSWEDAEKFGISGIPATVIIDRKGMVAFVTEGAVEWNQNGVDRVIGAIAEEGS